MAHHPARQQSLGLLSSRRRLLLYLRWLDEYARKFGCAIHAYVLMTNHVHLLLTPERTESAARLMKNLVQRYVRYTNRTYQRRGTL